MRPVASLSLVVKSQFTKMNSKEEKIFGYRHSHHAEEGALKAGWQYGWVINVKNEFELCSAEDLLVVYTVSMQCLRSLLKHDGATKKKQHTIFQVLTNERGIFIHAVFLMCHDLCSVVIFHPSCSATTTSLNILLSYLGSQPFATINTQ